MTTPTSANAGNGNLQIVHNRISKVEDKVNDHIAKSSRHEGTITAQLTGIAAQLNKADHRARTFNTLIAITVVGLLIFVAAVHGLDALKIMP